MKKLAFTLICILASVVFCFSFTACSSESCKHSYGDWFVTTNADCTNDGEQSRVCSKCNKIDTEKIPALGHTEVIDHAVEPQIGVTGLTQGSHCQICSVPIVEQHVIPALVLFSASVNNSSLGSVSVESKGVSVGESVTVSAINGKGTFEGWYYNEELVSTEQTYTFTMPEGNYSLMAKFTSLASIWDGSIDSQFEGGTGTETDPYLIATASQLAFLAQVTNDKNVFTYSSKYYKLINDIDLDNIPWTPIGVFYHGSGMNDASINMAFNGVFDGNGKTISNLKINNVEKTNTRAFGLFGRTNNFATDVRSVIKNLTIHNADVYAQNSYVDGIGILAGQTYFTRIENCLVSGTVKGSSTITGGNIPTVNAGGIVGKAYGYTDVVNCKFDGTVISSNYGGATAGGIAGDFTGSNMINTTASGVVKAEVSSNYSAVCGGLFGYLAGSSLKNSSSCATVYATQSGYTSSYAYGGGIVGTILNTDVYNCYSMGEVNVTSNSISCAGGFIGNVKDGNADGIVIQECYSTGKVNAEIKGNSPYALSVAGFIADAYNVTISNSFTSSSVSATLEKTDFSQKYYGRFSATDYSTAQIHSNVYVLLGATVKENGVQVNSFNENYGIDCELENLNSLQFYSDTLKWDLTKWNLTNLDAQNGKYPVFVPLSE